MRKTASNAHIWTKCPGYIKQAQAYIDRYGKPQSKAADEGLMAHAIAEQCLLSYVSCPDGDYEVPDTYDGIVVPTDMRIKVNAYVQKCISIVERIEACTTYVERDVRCSFLSNDVKSRLDFAVYDINKKELTIVDLKYGHRAVNAESNPQLLIYARAIIDSLEAVCREVNTVHMAIFQPNGPSASMPWQQWTQNANRVRLASEGIKYLYHMESDNLTPGSHCRYCEGRGTCDALQLALYECWDVMAAYTGTAVELSPERVEALLAESEMIKDLHRAYHTGLEAMVISRMQKGEAFPRWEYSTSLSDRKWDHPDVDIINLGKSMGIDLEKHTLLSPKQAEMAGIPKEVVDTLVRRDSTGLKLRKKSLKTLKQAFE